MKEQKGNNVVSINNKHNLVSRSRLSPFNKNHFWLLTINNSNAENSLQSKTKPTFMESLKFLAYI